MTFKGKFFEILRIFKFKCLVGLQISTYAAFLNLFPSSLKLMSKNIILNTKIYHLFKTKKLLKKLNCDNLIVYNPPWGSHSILLDSSFCPYNLDLHCYTVDS